MKFSRILLATCICSIILYYIYTHLSDFKFLLSINPIWYLPIIVLIVCRLLLRGVSLHVVLSTLKPKIAFRNFFKTFVFSQFLPQGGVVYQGVMLKKSYGLTYKDYLALMVAFKILKTLILLILCSVVITIFDRTVSVAEIPLYIIFNSLIVAVFILFSTIRVTQNRYPEIFNREFSIKHISTLFNIVKTISVFFSKSRIIGLIFLLITLNMVISVAILYCIFNSIGLQQSIVNLVIYSTTLKMVGIVRITPSNIGVREFFVGYLATVLGATAAQGITVSIIERIIRFCIQGVMSLIMNMLPAASENL